MNPGFFADPDSGFKSTDPDPSICKLMRSTENDGFDKVLEEPGQKRQC